MSIVAVHGPYTFGSKAMVANASGSAYANVNPANALIWTLYPKDQSRPDADYDWAYTPAGGSPASPIADTKTPTVTFTAGAKTVTLTLGGVAQGSFVINAAAGTAQSAGLLMAGEDEDEEVQAVQQRAEAPSEPASEAEDDSEPDSEVNVAFDPGAHTIEEVMAFVETEPDKAREVLDAERVGKNRVTLLTQLEELTFDPADYTVTQVIGYVEDHPEKVDDVIAAEQEGRNRTTLITQLESMRET